MAELRAKCAGQKVIFSVDRLDYTKGLINRLRGYDAVPEAQPAMARQGGVRAVGGALAHRRGELPGHEAGDGANRGPHCGGLRQRAIGRR